MRMLLLPIALAGTLVAAGTAAAGPARITLEPQVDKAGTVDIISAERADAAPTTMRRQQFANGDTLTTWDDAGVMTLCDQTAFIKVPASQPELANLPMEERPQLMFSSMMAIVGSIATVMARADNEAVFAADGSTDTRSVEHDWAYGTEQSELTSFRTADGALHVRMRKTANITTRPDTPEDAEFSTDEDLAARLAELTPVGSWLELVIHAGGKEKQVDPAFPLKGWLPISEGEQATVADARRAGGCQ